MITTEKYLPCHFLDYHIIMNYLKNNPAAVQLNLQKPHMNKRNFIPQELSGAQSVSSQLGHFLIYVFTIFTHTTCIIWLVFHLRLQHLQSVTAGFLLLQQMKHHFASASQPSCSEHRSPDATTALITHLCLKDGSWSYFTSRLVRSWLRETGDNLPGEALTHFTVYIFWKKWTYFIRET